MDLYDLPETVVYQNLPEIPVTCFRPAALKSSAKWFLANFPGKSLYAVKANPAPYVLKGLYDAGIRHFDCASLPEIELVQKLCPGSHIAFMHPVKSRQAIEHAYFDYGIRDFSFDTLEELNKIVTMTGKSKDLNLLLRLDVPKAESGLFMAGKFGCLPEKAPDLLKAARKVSKKLGICFHVGSQMMDPEAYKAALTLVGDIMRIIPRTKIDILDIGGGFPSIYPGMNPPPMEDYTEAIKEGLALLPNPGTYDVWCEPGRALVAESCSVITRVELRKDDALYLNDGTFGSLFDASLTVGFNFPMRLIRATPGKKKTVALKPFRFYGPTCTSEDYMPGPFMIPEDVKEGDYIEIGQLGAYGNTMRTAFNGFGEHEIVAISASPMATMYNQTAETEADELQPV
jgi:ornithine decarboxylase